VDVHVQGFEISESEKADLIAFLYALTDESALPEIPTSLPSGLPVVPRLENPAREVVQQMNRPYKGEQVEGRRDPQVLTVAAGQSIQSVIDQARSGDTIRIPYGNYSESLFIDEPGIHLIGLPNAKGAFPILEGEGKQANGVIATGDGFEMAFLELQGFSASGVLVKAARGVYLHDLSLIGPGTLGLAVELCSDVKIEHVKASGLRLAGVYASSSEQVSITRVEAHRNTIGIELENSIHSEVSASHTYENSVGIFVALRPHLSSKISRYIRVFDNLVENNNFDSYLSSNPLWGKGILVLASDHTEVWGNMIRGHENAGLAVNSLRGEFSDNKMDVGINPDFLYAHDNSYSRNKPDIAWDSAGSGNAFDEQLSSSSPGILPSNQWSGPAYNLYWRLLNFFP
jgi:nitrous oxidase accessory protein NosD